MLPYVYKSNKPGTKTVVTLVSSAPHGVETSTRRASDTRDGQGAIHGSQIIPYIYNSKILETNMVVPRVNTAPHGVETPTWGS